MRAAVTFMILAALAAPAAAESTEAVPMFPGVRTNNRPPSVYLSVVFGKIDSELNDDNYRRGMTRNNGWAYGMNVRGELVSMRTGYGGDFGFTMDVDFFLTTSGVIEGPQEPKASYVFLGLTPALALGAIRTKSFALTGELGFPLNTDFYGLSAGGFMNLGSFYLGYRVRSGNSWHGTEVLDERVRIGFGDIGSKVLAKTFFGIEVIDGYSEDDKGRADLRSMFRGSYTMISLVLSKGK